MVRVKKGSKKPGKSATPEPTPEPEPAAAATQEPAAEEPAAPEAAPAAPPAKEKAKRPSAGGATPKPKRARKSAAASTPARRLTYPEELNLTVEFHLAEGTVNAPLTLPGAANMHQLMEAVEENSGQSLPPARQMLSHRDVPLELLVPDVPLYERGVRGGDVVVCEMLPPDEAKGGEDDKEARRKARAAGRKSRATKPGRKHNERFTLAETTQLVKGVEQLGMGKWKPVLVTYFDPGTTRNDVQLKDKWRNLVRAAHAPEGYKHRGEALTDELKERVRKLCPQPPPPKAAKPAGEANAEGAEKEK